MSLELLYQEAINYPELKEPSGARQEGRFRGLFVGQDEMLEILCRVSARDKAGMPVYFVPYDLPELPKDAIVDGVHYDIARRGFFVVLASAEFEPVPAGMEIPLMDRPVMRRAVRTQKAEIVDGSVCLPSVVKTWEGGNANEAPSAQELPAGAVTEAKFFLDLPPRDEKLQAIMERHRPAKSEARLALEYDLRQAFSVAVGSTVDRQISEQPDKNLECALLQARDGNINIARMALSQGWRK